MFSLWAHALLLVHVVLGLGLLAAGQGLGRWAAVGPIAGLVWAVTRVGGVLDRRVTRIVA